MGIRYDSPALGDNAKELYSEIYGPDVGERFVKVLETAPYEIAVISRMIATLHKNSKSNNTEE